MYFQQRTVAKPVNCSGVGIHSGKKVNLTIKPAPPNHGIKFIRTDLLDCPVISAHFNMVVDTSLATVIGFEGFIVSTIEHLMASFAGLSIDNALVEIDGYEMPIMDGSAGPFTSLIKASGIKELGTPRYFFVIKEPIELNKDGKMVGVYPCSTYKITCTIEYDHPLINRQSYSVDVSDHAWVSEISKARTFGFLHEYEYLKKYGLARGVTLENVIAIDDKAVVNEGGLRYQDEFVRHKILDAIGDMSLIGMNFVGNYEALAGSHDLNHKLTLELLKDAENYEVIELVGEKTKELEKAYA